MKIKDVLSAIGLIAVSVALGAIFFSKKTTTQIPRIITQYDTIKTIDTAWVTKLKHDTVYKINIVEKITVTPPETVKVLAPTAGAVAVSVPKKIGDSTLIYGFRVLPADSGYLVNHWQYQYWTSGPFKSLVVGPSGATTVDFYRPMPTCGLKCKVKWGVGFTLGIELVRIMLGNP